MGIRVSRQSLSSSLDSRAAPTYRPTIVDLALGVARPWPRPWHIALCVAVFSSHVLLADPFYGVVAKGCAGLEGALLVLLVTRYAETRPPRLHWLEHAFAVHYAEFGLPIVTPPIAVGAWPQHGVPRTESFDLGAELALASGLAMIAAFAAARALARPVPGWLLFPKLEPESLAKACRWYVPIAAGFVLLNALEPRMNAFLLPVLGIVQQFFYHSQLLVVATTAYLVHPRPSTLLLLLGATLTVISLLVLTSVLGKVLVPFLGVVVLWWRARERLPVWTLLFASLLMLAVQPAKKYYRDLRWNDRSQTSVADAWKEAFARRADDARSAFGNREEEGANAAIGRLSQLSETAHVIEAVPTRIPYGDGMIYPRMAAGMVPRVLWPEKPNMTEYALDTVVVELGLFDSRESGFSVCGISLPAQGYFEHGVAGGVAWMALLGILLGFASRLYPPNLAGVIGSAAAIANLGLAQEGGFYSVFGGAWQLFFGSVLLSWFLWLLAGKARFRRPNAGASE
jgi:hypothetical protein